MAARRVAVITGGSVRSPPGGVPWRVIAVMPAQALDSLVGSYLDLRLRAGKENRSNADENDAAREFPSP